MLDIYSLSPATGHLQKQESGIISDDAVWLDLISPTLEEEQMVERACGIAVPTREEMREIEVSSRLYSEDGADFMTASVIFGLDDGTPGFAPVTFILAGKRLVTLRYTRPKSFVIFAAKQCRELSNGGRPTHLDDPASLRAPNGADKTHTADMILIGLLETIVDRVADMLETLSNNLDGIGDDIFAASAARKPTGTPAFKELLRRLGAAGDLASRVREALATFDRLLPFLQFVLDGRKPGKEARPRVKVMARDVQSLNDFVNFLSNKTTFLLDTTVGMISIEQNAIIKIFSVASVAFMPPTLVASVYGMNFEHMPELGWTLGYPYALGLMVVSAVLPMLFFRYKNWL
ncbi:magnesium transporter CorA family protein [Mangrovicella endophytica]|uniref:magnesium transporter CorA family protein n=1 Tax=Mangrovicella endophytica TaxID=2066697 RepID=UPI000C9DCDE6|nr:magnesium transporter CorA family protein [Mangrovicella endophytica]